MRGGCPPPGERPLWDCPPRPGGTDAGADWRREGRRLSAARGRDGRAGKNLHGGQELVRRARAGRTAGASVHPHRPILPAARGRNGERLLLDRPPRTGGKDIPDERASAAPAPSVAHGLNGRHGRRWRWLGSTCPPPAGGRRAPRRRRPLRSGRSTARDEPLTPDGKIELGRPPPERTLPACAGPRGGRETPANAPPAPAGKIELGRSLLYSGRPTCIVANGAG